VKDQEQSKHFGMKAERGSLEQSSPPLARSIIAHASF